MCDTGRHLDGCSCFNLLGAKQFPLQLIPMFSRPGVLPLSPPIASENHHEISIILHVIVCGGVLDIGRLVAQNLIVCQYPRY